MKTTRTALTGSCLFLAGAAAVIILGGCERKPAAPRSALLLSQAQFVDQAGPDGKSHKGPGPAKLVLVYPRGDTWTSEVLEDPDGNVFHKAMPFDLPGERPGILTIAAHKAPNPATLKVWRRTARGWTGTLLWKEQFGGDFNRFRDVEIADVTGDGKPEIVIATHDQGVVAVLRKQGENWEPTVVDQAPDTFVHEIEIGDVDGDGLSEIFATPSAPNRADGTPQPGWVVMYRFDAGQFVRHVVEEFADRHVKEILVADLEGTGRSDLYAALEVELGSSGDPAGAPRNVEIKRYRFDQPDPAGEVIVSLPDRQCRFLNAGDVDGDGKPELVASAFRSGIWIIKPQADGWEVDRIDQDSSGYEHATALADLDGDGTPEIYVAADDQHQLRRYRWTGQRFERTDLYEITGDHISFGLMPCLDAGCLAPQ